MLRALGVLFILCFCFFLGLAGIVVGYLVLRSEFWRAGPQIIASEDVEAEPTRTARKSPRARPAKPSGEVRLVAHDETAEDEGFLPLDVADASEPIRVAALPPTGLIAQTLAAAPGPESRFWIRSAIENGGAKFGSTDGLRSVPTRILLKGSSLDVYVQSQGPNPELPEIEKIKQENDNAAPAGQRFIYRGFPGSAPPPNAVRFGHRQLDRVAPVVVRPLNPPFQPNVTGVANTPLDFAPYSSQSAPVRIYNGFFRLRFTSAATSPGQHVFYGVYGKKDSTEFEGVELSVRNIQPVPAGGQNVYEATIQFNPSLNWETLEVFVVTDLNNGGGSHSYAPNPVKFENGTPGTPQQVAPLRQQIVDVLRPKPIPPGRFLVGDVLYVNSEEITLDFSSAIIPDGQMAVYRGSERLASGPLTTALKIPLGRTGPMGLEFRIYQGEEPIVIVPQRLYVQTAGPRFLSADTMSLTGSSDGNTIIVYFDPAELIPIGAFDTGAFTLLPESVSDPTKTAISSAIWDESRQAAILTVDRSKLVAGRMVLTGVAAPDKIRDVLGNPLGKLGTSSIGKNFTHVFAYTPGFDAPGVTRGVRSTGAPQILYPEFTDPRPVQEGFNPSDKVISRIARLYYFRDAHRVSQLVNRKARSYNRAAVEMNQQLADKARTIAESTTDDRRGFERKAVRAAQDARQAEEALRAQQEALMAARAEENRITQELDRTTSGIASIDALIQQQQAEIDALKLIADPTSDQKNELAEKERDLNSLNAERAVRTNARTSLQTQSANARSQVQAIEGNIRNLLGQVEAKRQEEILATEKWEETERKEERAVQEQFRREVAAANEDPDTFAPGDPTSYDPVAQVSVAVVGEGLIQLRGPRKGVNIVHTMINELDAPLGQTRINVHTIQINGERGERIEQVATRIQRYVDHSRFLTMQSSQYLRNAVVIVASRLAEDCNNQFSDCPLTVREQKYREAFFGKDFLDELRELDSEFLKADNKVLSLHSMDTTSLANALFLLALAKNDTREEILLTFFDLVQTKLPADEMEYFEASAAEGVVKSGCKKKPFTFMAQNAKFVNLRGFFQNEGIAPDTLNPAQREFVRLAQIFKARLVTEIELRQRVMERSLIEQRIGPNQTELSLKAVEEEQAAKVVLQIAQEKLVRTQQQLLDLLPELNEIVTRAIPFPAARFNMAEDLLARFRGIYTQIRASSAPVSNAKSSVARIPIQTDTEAMVFGELPRQFEFEWKGHQVSSIITEERRIDFQSVVDVNGQEKDLNEFVGAWKRELLQSYVASVTTFRTAAGLKLTPELEERRVQELEMLRTADDTLTGDELDPLMFRNILIVAIASRYQEELHLAIVRRVRTYVDRARDQFLRLEERNVDIGEISAEWRLISNEAKDFFRSDALLAEFNRKALDPIEQLIVELRKSAADVRFATRIAEERRRPLDHKKFLDMLIDDVEEKYIELVEGTRAHTANVDNYVKRLATALDDDFNTQFYFPAFRYAREASQFYDVQVGQVETTGILTNNRAFAKVSPQATMEFDLPKRDILINEAFQSALAAYNDYGALLADPQFLALSRMYGGQPASATYGGGLPAPMTRNVLPGLPSSTDAQFLNQAENNVPQIGSNLEALIPDPAVYKFETGTGYEIRPVIQPDGQAVVFHLNYMYTTNIREPVRADEKHLGRVKRHFIDTDVQLGNYELREVSRYQVALKASRTSRGVPLLEDAPGIGVLFRPLPQQESSLQQNIILAQSVIFPTLFDLMGLRWAPAVSDLGTTSLQEREFVTRKREQYLRNEVFDYSSLQVDDFMRIPPAERRPDLYRAQDGIPLMHPNGYQGNGLNRERGTLKEGYLVPSAPDASYDVPAVPYGAPADPYAVPTSPGGRPPAQIPEPHQEEFSPIGNRNANPHLRTPARSTGVNGRGTDILPPPDLAAESKAPRPTLPPVPAPQQSFDPRQMSTPLSSAPGGAPKMSSRPNADRAAPDDRTGRAELEPALPMPPRTLVPPSSTLAPLPAPGEARDESAQGDTQSSVRRQNDIQPVNHLQRTRPSWLKPRVPFLRPKTDGELKP